MFHRIQKSAMTLKSVRTLAVTGVLVALGVVLGLLRIDITPQMRASFSFLAIAAVSVLFGYVPSAMAAVLIDLLLLVLKPSGGYFFGFTITALVSAFFFSLFLYDRPAPMHDLDRPMGHGRSFLERKDRHFALRCLLCMICVDVVCNLALNTFWHSMLYGEGFLVLLPARAIKNAILFVPESVLLFFCMKAVQLAWDQIKR